MYAFPRGAVRILYGVGAFVVGDLVTGLAAFSAIAAGSLWFFSLGWIRLQSEYTAIGVPFGTPLQLEMAWVGAIGGLPLVAGVLYLGASAIRLPVGWFRRARCG